MSRHGPKPTPKAILKLRGSWRAGTRADDKTPCERPARPQWLTGDAHKEWKRIIPILEKIGMLAEIDRGILASYCYYYGEWKEACQKLMKKGCDKVITSPKGYEYPNPWIAIRNTAWDKMKKALDAMGMSPAARTGISVTPKQPKGKDKSRFFEKRGS